MYQVCSLLILLIRNVLIGSVNWNNAIITHANDISTNKNAIRKWYLGGLVKNDIKKKIV